MEKKATNRLNVLNLLAPKSPSRRKANLLRLRSQAKQLILTSQSQAEYPPHQPQRGQHSSSFYQKFELLQKIGWGCNSVVKKCRRISDSKIYAVKIMRCQQQQSERIKSSFLLLKGLRHPAIVQVHYLYAQQNTCQMVMDYISQLTLRQSPIPTYNEQSLRMLAQQLIDVLYYLHNKGICHRDIKPDNLMIDNQREKIKLIDFGISRFYRNRFQSCHMLSQDGTLAYQAPQLLKGKEYTNAVDIWSAGVLLYQSYTGILPFKAQFISQLKNKIINQEVLYPKNIPTHIQKFLSLLLTKDQSQRKDASFLLKHPFLIKGRKYTNLMHKTKSNDSTKKRDSSANSDGHADFDYFCKEIFLKTQKHNNIINIKRCDRRASCQQME